MSQLHEGTFVAYYGTANEWKLYRRSDGMIVGYRSIANKDEEVTRIERIVTDTEDTDKFGDYIDRRSPKAKRYNPYKDDKQTRIE